MEGGRQLRLLLWRDYLIRKRNFITLAGIVWASGIMFGIYTVRMNIYNQDFPTCQFPARALPSAGMLPFLQSFMCSASNECSPMDKYEEIPAYEDSKLTKIRRMVEPFMNESIMDLAYTVPSALKLLATISNVADEPTFVEVAKNGLQMSDLFQDASRVKRYVTSQLDLDDDAAQTLISSQISFQGIMNNKMSKNCNPEFISNVLIMENPKHAELIANKICSLTRDEMQKMFMDLIYEMNLSKYVKMLGNMYYKLSGDDRLTKLGDFVTAIFRMTKLKNLLPSELYGIWYGKQSDFSYLKVDVIQKFLDLFKSTFGETEEFKSVKELADILVVGAQYLNNVFGNITANETTEQVTGILGSTMRIKSIDGLVGRLETVFQNTLQANDNIKKVKQTTDPFAIITKLLSFILKFLPSNDKSEITFYATLIAKVIESAHKVVMVNTHIEDMTYNVTLRNPEAVKILTNLPPETIKQGLEALMNPERTQILTSKLDTPEKLFCDLDNLRKFFLISPTEAKTVKDQLCHTAWRNFVKDFINSFGFYDVQDNINQIASLFIQKTLGRDMTSQLYSIEQDVNTLKNFTLALMSMESEEKPVHRWHEVLKVKEDSELMRTLNDVAKQGKSIMISVHGSMAKKVVTQNKLLEMKINPVLQDTSTIVIALLEQLYSTDEAVPQGMKEVYGDVIQTVLLTALNDGKTYKALSTYCRDIFCQGSDIASTFIDVPENTDVDKLVSVLCNTSLAIESGLRNDSILSRYIAKIRSPQQPTPLDWTLLVTNIQKLFRKLSDDYPYLFEYSTYGMDMKTQKYVQKLLQNGKDYWFSLRNLPRALHISVKLGFRFLDLLDHDIFEMDSKPWIKFKHITNSAIGPLNIIDDGIQLVTALFSNTSHTSKMPPITVDAVSKIIPNLGQLIVDTVDLLSNDTTDIEPIISLMNSEPAWPCSPTSISELLALSPPSQEAVRGLETIFCMKKDMQQEWVEYFKEKRVDKSAIKSSTVEPHVFLRISSVFSSLINDTNLIKNALQYVQSDNTTMDHVGLITAWKYAVNTFTNKESQGFLRQFFIKVDTVINSLQVMSTPNNASINALWDAYIKCANSSIIEDECRAVGRAAWKYTLQVVSVIFDNIAGDLSMYFTEVNSPDVNPLQVLGFTKSTPLYMLFDRMAEFVSVLINSYWDFGFMSQIRRATQTRFWDCEAVVSTMTPALDSPVQREHILKVQPYLCPSIIYWLSLPRGENVFFDMVAKPQYYIYSLPVINSTSRFEKTFVKATSLADYLEEVSKNKTSLKKELEIDSIKNKLEKFLDKITSYKIDKNNPSYLKFRDMYKKQFLLNVYLARIVTITNKAAEAFGELTFENVQDNEKLNADVKFIRNLSRRKPVDLIALHFDIITDVIWTNDDNYTIGDALASSCNNNRTILSEGSRIKPQICAKNYKMLYQAIEPAINDEEARESLMNLVQVMQEDDNVTDIFELMNERKQYVQSLRSSIKYAYDLGLAHFLKYQQTNLQSYRVLISFISGDDWWKTLLETFNGPQSTKFFGYLEQIFEVSDNILRNLDGIQLVRLIRDLNINETDSICRLNVSEYFPDSTGVIGGLARQGCDVDRVELFREVPPLLYASQGYENSLTLSKEVDYNTLMSDISMTEDQLKAMTLEAKDPQRPMWVTEERINTFKEDMMHLLSKESITKVVFGVLKNGVDAGTLFLNTSDCTLCSQLTTWFKQLNLQIIKKPDYELLLCHINSMSLDDIHRSLKNDFHWDMFIKEVISSRNYTKFELNKSMNEFLHIALVHLLEDMSAGTNKVAECLSQNVTKNGFGNATVLVSVLSRMSTLLRAQTPHLHEVEGISSLPYLNTLFDRVAHRLDVEQPLQEYLQNSIDEELMVEVKDKGLVTDIRSADIKLGPSLNKNTLQDIIQTNTNSIEDICEEHNCAAILKIIRKHLNMEKINKDLKSLQQKEFWKLPFVSSILHHVEVFLSHVARLLGIASNLEVNGVVAGRIESTIDMAVRVFLDDNVDGIIMSINGLISELKPLLQESELYADINALSTGLRILFQFKKYVLEEHDLKIRVMDYFPTSEGVEASLADLGINNTNFWSIAAPRIAAGYINMVPVISPKNPKQGISSFVCDMDLMPQTLQPAALDVVTAEDVMAATSEQFCGLDNEIAKQMPQALMSNMSWKPLLEKLKDLLLEKLFSASALSEEQGSMVLRRMRRLSDSLPTLQDTVERVMSLVVDDPLIKSLQDFTTIGNLMSPKFLSDAGNMMCGKPFKAEVHRVMQSILSAPDHNTGLDDDQLRSLPTEYCRSLYADIVSIEGGKIVWTFIKPLIMGRILYTPQTPTVQRIITKVNETFVEMIRMTDLLHEFAAAFPSLGAASSHSAGLDALQRLLATPGMQPVKDQLLGPGVDFNVDVRGLFDKLGDLKGIGGLLSKASALLRCVRLDRLQAEPDEHQLMHSAARLTIVNEFSAGLVFLNTENATDSNHIEYKIRMDIENAPTTVRMQSYLWTPGPEASFIEHMRYFRGFVQIQDIVDTAVINLAAEENRNKREATAHDDDWAVYTQQIPYPCYRMDFFQTSLYESQSLVVGFFFSMLFTVAAVVRFIVADKETGNTMLMSVMGVDLRLHTLSWFVSSFAETSLTVLCMTLILKWGMVLPRSDPTLVFTLLFIYGISMLSFCYLMSRLFTSASFAAVCAGILYLITFMPYVLIISLEAVMESSLKLLICLSMSSSLCYAFLYIMRFEAMGIGANWSLIYDSPNNDDMHIAYAAMMMLVDAVIYFIIGLIIDRYFGIKTVSSNIINSEVEDEKVGVSIMGVSKIYHEGSRKEKVALDNVSMELHRGQITTLLGHNGAGKTTLIKILTGMLKPTRGHVVTRGAGAGVCPQHDVLVECLTCREHVALYAQIHGGATGDELEKEVDRMLQRLSLAGVAGVAARALSGGTRRRLCVALAFLARGALVVLDEPTAGVDPHARREIWSMIVKLKQDRTILLTTHHLDEADILSDQIIIMHKGQIHTTGSPVEIKRSLGSGYRLTVRLREAAGERAERAERAESVVRLVRAVVPGAALADVSDHELDVAVPFYDEFGADNNMLELCKKLEENEEKLGVKGYSLEGSTLEQVFYDICNQADADPVHYDPSGQEGSKSNSVTSAKSDRRPLVEGAGARRGTRRHQFRALMKARYLHFIRNRWLLVMLIGLPFFFVTVAMAFSTLRPPADNEISLLLTEDLYPGSTQFLVPYPSLDPYNINSSFAHAVMQQLHGNKSARLWTEKDNPKCHCTATRQVCEIEPYMKIVPELMILPDVDTMNDWLVKTQEIYMQRRYGGYSSTIQNNKSHIIAWYNNKGHHALPAHLSALNNAVLRARAGAHRRITTYSHPMKISKEQISKDTVYQHIADAGVAALVLVALALAGGGGAVPLVRARVNKEKRLQYLAAVSPQLYWTAAILWDVGIMFINMLLTAGVMLAFGFPVFVARNNLPAICVLIMLYGFSCGSLVHLLEKLFTDPSLANMILFCGNAFCGLVGITILLILEIISESDATDNLRWFLHKLFLVSPQFALGDGMIEIAKNTVQAQVLERFGMDTYRDPLGSALLALHYSYLVLTGALLFAANLALECGYFNNFKQLFMAKMVDEHNDSEPEDVAAERKRVAMARREEEPLTVATIGNINKGFVHTEGLKNSLQRSVASARDVVSCESLGKVYGGPCAAPRAALAHLTLGVQPGQCLALLGENGAGKSTTFSLLTGELLPTSGKIYINGIERDTRGLTRGLISYCPQVDAVDPLLTVRETLEFYCSLRGISDEDNVIERTLDLFELCKYAEVAAGALSGGNRRKLCAAIAFMGRAPLVLLDEPTSGMDPVSRACVWAAGRARRAAGHARARGRAPRRARRGAAARRTTARPGLARQLSATVRRRVRGVRAERRAGRGVARAAGPRAARAPARAAPRHAARAAAQPLHSGQEGGGDEAERHLPADGGAAGQLRRPGLHHQPELARTDVPQFFGQVGTELGINWSGPGEGSSQGERPTALDHITMS